MRAGLAVLPADTGAAVICLGDMPHVDSALISRLIASFDPAQGQSICVPTYKGKRGNPVLWGKAFFPELASMSGDSGGRQLLDDHQAVQNLVQCDDPAILRDVDTADALMVMIREMATDNASDN